MDTTNLTPEDRAVLRQLAQSSGWALLMERLFVPRVQQITQLLDRPSVEQSGQADYLRGEKRAYMAQLEMLYSATGIPNPLEVYALGLLKAVARHPEEGLILVPKTHIARQGKVLCGALDGLTIPVAAEENELPTCEMCYTIFQEMHARRSRGRATLV